MSRVFEAPVTEATSRGTKTTHPAFGQIVAVRTSGRANLYGSDFQHQSWITIKIATSSLNRNLERDWHHGNERLIEVSLSEAQWATFITAMGVGDGTPCTLESVFGKAIPELPDPPSRISQFEGEMREKLDASIKEIDAAMAAVDAAGLSRPKAEAIKGRLYQARMQIASNAPFVAHSFSEHMEGEVEKAKSEIHGYMTGAIQRAGLESIGVRPPLALSVTADRDDSQ